MIWVFRRGWRLRVAIAVLLPALLYRALIPVGFMPMVGANGALELDVCPGTHDALSILLAAQPHGHHHMDDSGFGSTHAGHHFPCPYAASGTPALAPTVPAAIPLAIIAEQVFTPRRETVFPPAILRTQFSRGPPTSV